MTITDLAELVALIDRRVGKVESAKLTPSQQTSEDLAREAVVELSRSWPRRLVHELAGDGTTRRWVLVSTLNTAGREWLDGYSEIETVFEVYDAGTDDETKRELKAEEFETYLDTNDQAVLFLGPLYGSQTTIRIVYTRPHSINNLDGATSTTVLERQTEALILLGSAIRAGWIARTAADLANRAVGIDQVDYHKIGEAWSIRAQELRKSAIEHAQPTELGAGAAGTSVDWDTESLLVPGVPRLSH
jgi:hypothetical protein